MTKEQLITAYNYWGHTLRLHAWDIHVTVVDSVPQEVQDDGHAPEDDVTGSSLHDRAEHGEHVVWGWNVTIESVRTSHVYILWQGHDDHPGGWEHTLLHELLHCTMWGLNCFPQVEFAIDHVAKCMLPLRRPAAIEPVMPPYWTYDLSLLPD